MSFSNTTNPPLNNPTNQRLLVDNAYVVSNIALPNAANTVNSNSLDLLQATPYPVTDRVDFQILLTAGTGANNKNINVRVQESADNGNWTNAVGLANPMAQVIDNGNTTTSTANVIFKLQPVALRYLRIQMTGEANGGTGANGAAVLQALF